MWCLCCCRGGQGSSASKAAQKTNKEAHQTKHTTHSILARREQQAGGGTHEIEINFCEKFNGYIVCVPPPRPLEFWFLILVFHSCTRDCCLPDSHVYQSHKYGAPFFVERSHGALHSPVLPPCLPSSARVPQQHNTRARREHVATVSLIAPSNAFTFLFNLLECLLPSDSLVTSNSLFFQSITFLHPLHPPLPFPSPRFDPHHHLNNVP